MDFDYLNRRMCEERDRAAEAETDAARDAHLALAEQYRMQIQQMGADDVATDTRAVG